MTNLQASAANSVLTRERLLVGLPIVVSGLVLIGLGIGVIAPALGRIDELNNEVVALQAKKQRLPGLRNQLRQSQQEQQTLFNQQSMLVELIAGQDRIATFLALLEQAADATGVTIDRYEPQSPPKPTVPSQSGRPSRSKSKSKSKKTTPPADPMKALGYRRTFVSVGVSGGYGALQSFLQRMEALEVVVEAADLELTSSTDATSGNALTELALRLSFFDRQSEPATTTPPVKPG